MPLHQLTQLIDRHFEALSPELQRAARWVREHPSALGLQSMRHSAQAAGVAPATMTRLAQALGVGGFEGLRAPVIQHLSETSRRSSPINEQATSDGARGSLGHLVRTQVANVHSIESNSPAAFSAAAQAILAARSVGFLGLRASFGIAHHLQYTCDWLRRDTWLVVEPVLGGSDRLSDLGETDLLVVVSQAPYTRPVVEAAQELHARGVPVLALTDSPLSPLAGAARWVLLFDTHASGFFHSMAGAQALAEVLMNEVATMGGDAVALRLAQRQQRHRDARTYWERGPRTPRMVKTPTTVA
ncbi:MurR/RpiR family transcriptional regulator [Hydrogenophaga sp. PAMC20947]|uniref:MurR/RpiR family transcriptional regulator n=1 Tax=Hydrogenophaga sp. PAMC20947 TaxID=2565558 RepID=UPI00109DE9EB|nr:MurR/RpiR family transcriptional regulator [Hydrogenophaga sp. PAMC20947]QCB45085.1 MurR/RpiR family transcriptional regulator [Hydrogenophaga sp. PAMC20947]